MRKIWYFPLWLALFLLIWLGRSGCDHKKPIPDSGNTLKIQIQKHEQARDSAKKEATKTEVKQKDVKKRWRSARANIPKDTTKGRDSIFKVIYVCDTLVFTDSVLIGQLKEVVKQDSLIIAQQRNLIIADSLTILDLTKTVKKEKRKSWWKGFKAGFITGNITGIVGSQLTIK